MSEHNTEFGMESAVGVTVIRADGRRIPLGNITTEAAPKNPVLRFLWVLNIKAKLRFPGLYGYKKPKH